MCKSSKPCADSGKPCCLLAPGEEPGVILPSGTRERGSVLECAGPPALSSVLRPAQSSRGLEHSRALSRVFTHQ